MISDYNGKRTTTGDIIADTLVDLDKNVTSLVYSSSFLI